MPVLGVKGPLLPLHRHPGVVPHLLAHPRQRIEKGRLPRIRVPHQRYECRIRVQGLNAVKSRSQPPPRTAGINEILVPPPPAGPPSAPDGQTLPASQAVSQAPSIAAAALPLPLFPLPSPSGQVEAPPVIRPSSYPHFPPTQPSRQLLIETGSQISRAFANRLFFLFFCAIGCNIKPCSPPSAPVRPDPPPPPPPPPSTPRARQRGRLSKKNCTTVHFIIALMLVYAEYLQLIIRSPALQPSIL